ncbi:MAG: succinate dehydrogenase, hydrophobic membrane anchor protein [Desulfohalobiaceae bacterium]|nr:succinate dehydrogenase, hydrophobic membrane anchor protein [Desulfohalobiaceae bacterium]
MNTEKNTEPFHLQVLNALPGVSYYARTRGPSFVTAWAHRISGLILVGYLLFHLLTLSLLAQPEQFEAKMSILDTPFFALLEFLLAIPLIFHALNGVRLMLYEHFTERDNVFMLHWLGSLGFLYILLLGLFMWMGSQTVSALFFGMSVLAASLLTTGFLFQKIWWTTKDVWWKLQRLTAAFLLIVLPGHMLFMHLNYALGHQAGIIISRMGLPFMQCLYLLTVVSVLYHAVYGLISVIQDYVEKRLLRFGLIIGLLLFTIYFLFLGLRLTFFIA